MQQVAARREEHVCALAACEMVLMHPPRSGPFAWAAAPYEGKDADEKFAFFLQAFLPALRDPEPFRAEWEREYEEVLQV